MKRTVDESSNNWRSVTMFLRNYMLLLPLLGMTASNVVHSLETTAEAKTTQNTTETTAETSDARIIGGDVAGATEFPFMITMMERSNMSIVCGGVLLSPEHVLTACQCFYSANKKDKVGLLGMIFLAGSVTTDVLSKTARLILAAWYEVHPECSYKTDSGWNRDYAIAGLRKKLDVIEGHINPLTLPKVTKSEVEDIVKGRPELTTCGWGYNSTEPGAISGSELLKTKVELQPIDPNKPDVVFTKAVKKSSSVCVGDIGGPLLYTKGKDTLVFGILSIVTNCQSEGLPQGWMRIDRAAEWVEAEMKKERNAGITTQIHVHGLTVLMIFLTVKTG